VRWEPHSTCLCLAFGVVAPEPPNSPLSPVCWGHGSRYFL
jgi:hypothetical protein